MKTKKPNGYWKIKENVLAEAKKHKTRTEFSKSCSQAYSMALKEFPEAFDHMTYQATKADFWNDKTKVLEDAQKYNTIRDWIRASGAAYTSAKRNGWFEQATAHMIKTRVAHNTWANKANVLAKATDYSSLSEWSKKSPGSYNAASKQGWIAEASAHMVRTRKPIGYWDNKENVANEAEKYKNRTEWNKKSGASYNAARKNNWLDELMPSKIKPLLSWTFDELQTEASKYNTRGEFMAASLSAYKSASKQNLLDLICMHMKFKPMGFWRDPKNVKADALNYDNKTDWIKGNPAAYEGALAIGVIEECCAHMKVYRLPQNTWTQENIIAEARKFKTRKDWRHSGGGSYGAACEMNILVEAEAHMLRLRLATDCVYILKACTENVNGKSLYKCGVSSEANLSKRLANVEWNSGIAFEMLGWVYTGEKMAKNYERELLSLGEDAKLISTSGIKLTEYRYLTTEELSDALNIIEQVSCTS